jgi:hypothetical protein
MFRQRDSGPVRPIYHTQVGHISRTRERRSIGLAFLFLLFLDDCQALCL